MVEIIGSTLYVARKYILETKNQVEYKNFISSLPEPSRKVVSGSFFANEL